MITEAAEKMHGRESIQTTQNRRARNAEIARLVQQVVSDQGGVCQISEHYTVFDNRKYEAVLIDERCTKNT